MKDPNRNVQKESQDQEELKLARERVLASIMGITLEEYREIGCQDTTDLDGSTKVYWSAHDNDPIVAKIRGKQAVDDDHVTITQDMSQLGDSY